MELLRALGAEFWTVLVTVARALPWLAAYVVLILLTLAVWRGVKRFLTPRQDFGSLKTVTFGDNRR